LDKLNDREIILQELATLNPLDDRAFRILLSDDEQFIVLAEALLGQKLDEDKIININGEIVLSVKGRLIRLDALRDTNIGYVNMEGQMDASDFPFKRHVFHGAFVYVNGIQKSGSWDELKPAISIVVYKDKGGDAVIETASLSGSLVKSSNDKNQLQLMAVNSKQWKEAESEELRIYLSTLHNGIMTDENKGSFVGVDTDADTFLMFQRAVRLACAKTKQQEYKEKGDDFMATQYATYLTDEERVAAKEEGENTAFGLAVEIISMLKAGVPTSEIAEKCRVKPRVVEELRIAL